MDNYEVVIRVEDGVIEEIFERKISKYFKHLSNEIDALKSAWFYIQVIILLIYNWEKNVKSLFLWGTLFLVKRCKGFVPFNTRQKFGNDTEFLSNLRIPSRTNWLQDLLKN